jgi:hypothetical protein
MMEQQQQLSHQQAVRNTITNGKNSKFSSSWSREPRIMGIGPVEATKSFSKSQFVDQIDVIEIK